MEMSSNAAIPVPPKKIQQQQDLLALDDLEEVEVDVGLDEEGVDSDAGGGDDDSASKQSTDNDDETGSQSSEGDETSSSSIGGDEEIEGETAAGVGARGDEEGGSDDETLVGSSGANKAKKNKKKRSSGKKDTEDDLTLLGVPHGINFDDNPDEDEDEDADRDSSEYFQKLGAAVSESYIETYHPESMSHNYDEIQTLSRVVRNSAGVIVDDLHRTIPIMTKYEKTRILGQRAKQLNEGAPAFIKIDSTVIDGYLIAVKELEQKKTPFIIRRPLPNGGSEYWRIQDLEIL